MILILILAILLVAFFSPAGLTGVGGVLIVALILWIVALIVRS